MVGTALVKAVDRAGRLGGCIVSEVLDSVVVSMVVGAEVVGRATVVLMIYV